MIFADPQKLSLRVFSSTYCEARRKFRAAAPESLAYPSTAKGPAGEALYTDVAYFGPSDACKVLVLISGTHGVEGYCGSAGQLLFVEAGLHKTLPPSTAVLLVHALNCYGFAWDRRVTWEGCDLNRNFVDFSQSLPSNSGYEQLADHFVPPDISEAGIQSSETALAAYQAEHGPHAFRKALSSGQYTRPGGMFYGGTAPTEARRTLEQIASDFELAARDEVIIVDYHTGLGPYGYGELQCEETSGIAGYERAFAIFGHSVTSADLGSSTSAAIPGTQDAFWQRALPGPYVYVALEFGTYPSPGGRHVLRDDHWLFKYRSDEADKETGKKIRQATRKYYYPEFDDWKEMVLSRSYQVNCQAVSAFSKRS